MRSWILEKDFMVDNYRCVIIGTNMGHRCGYVALPAPHKCIGIEKGTLNNYVTVHGGLTFGKFSDAYPIPTDEELWWLGFDCAHAFDLLDAELIDSLCEDDKEREILGKYARESCLTCGHLWTTEDVERELRSLVDQLRQFEGVAVRNPFEDKEKEEKDNE